MKLLIDIPKEFVAHFEQDKFTDSLERIRADINYSLVVSNILSAGNYELKLIEMLIEVFKNCKRVNTTTISDAPLMEMEDRLCEYCEQYKSCPDGKHCRTCDNGSKWKRSKEND